MARRKIMLVFGTRPEAIKMAPLVHSLKKHPKDFSVVVCVTAQHRQMLDQVLQIFDILPDLDLDIMKDGQDLFDVTSAILLGMRSVLGSQKPDLVLVHGDTSTTLAAATACFYAKVPVGHIEAGLRTHDLSAPFPEEFNRQVASKIANWHFAPTARSEENLLAESINKKHIYVTGNTVIDALHWVLNKIDSNQELKNRLTQNISAQLNFDWQRRKFLLVTGHRRENFGQGFLQICKALHDISLKYSDLEIVFPVHLNPNVRKPVNEILAQRDNIHLIEPLDYENFILLLRASDIVLTDSGGIQEEAPSLGKPVLVMRDMTERPEALEAGTVELVGADADRIVNGVSKLLDDPSHYERLSMAINPYGDGRACERIAEALMNSRGLF